VVDGGGDGFLFHDAIPSMIDAACTGTVAEGNSLYDAQTRARNMFSFMFHGGAYTDGYEPIGGYTADHVKAEMKRYFSKETMGYLNALRESVNIAPHGIPGASFVPAKNGYVRSAKDPFTQEYTFPTQDSTNTSASDSTYGNQQWGYQFGDGVICPCPDPCIGFEGHPPSQCCCITATKKVWTNGEVCCCILNISMNNREENPSEGCECESSRTVTVSVDVSVGSDSCGFGPGCDCRSIQISPPSGNCTTATLEVEGGGSYDPEGNEPSIACQCGFGPPPGTDEVDTEIDVEGFGCNSISSLTSNKKSSEYYSDVFEDGMATNRLSLIADIQNYKRANNTERFILTRRGSKTNWISIYSGIIQGTTIPLSFQTRSTLLNPVVSLNAIKTHTDKDINVYMPGQYFEP
jgi:hypothetical protein